MDLPRRGEEGCQSRQSMVGKVCVCVCGGLQFFRFLVAVQIGVSRRKEILKWVLLCLGIRIAEVKVEIDVQLVMRMEKNKSRIFGCWHCSIRSFY